MATQGLTRPVNFASLESGVGRTLSKSQYIHDLTDPEAQYAVIRNYWRAMKETFTEEWARPKDFLLLKNIGVVSMSILGGTIIDRCIARGSVDVDDLKLYLEQAKARFDWSKNAVGDRAVTGMSGNRAALIIAGEMAAELTDPDSGNVIRDLQAKLTAQAARRPAETLAPPAQGPGSWHRSPVGGLAGDSAVTGGRRV